jgi:hypothetical protein
MAAPLQGLEFVKKFRLSKTNSNVERIDDRQARDVFEVIDIPRHKQQIILQRSSGNNGIAKTHLFESA